MFFFLQFVPDQAIKNFLFKGKIKINLINNIFTQNYKKKKTLTTKNALIKSNDTEI